MKKMGSILNILLLSLALIGFAGCDWHSSDSTNNTVTDDDTNTTLPEANATLSWSSIQYLEADSSVSAVEPQITMNENGDVIAVWVQNAQLWSSRYVAGSGWAVPESVANSTNSAQVQIAIDASGDAIAVWTDSGDMSIHYSRNSSGSGWSTPAALESGTGYAALPQIAMDGSGNAIAVWKEYRSGTSYIWFSRYDLGTDSWSASSAITSTSEFIQNYGLDLAVNASGDAVVVWIQSATAITTPNVWSSQYDAGTWSGAALLQEGVYAPQVAIDGDGNAFAVWEHWETERNVYATRYVPGSGWGTPETIENNTTNAGMPQIAVDGSGNAIAVWQQGEGSSSRTAANRYTVGSGWGTALFIDLPEAGAIYPRLAVNANGDGIAVWQQSNGTTADIWANFYTTGSGWGTAEAIEDFTATATEPEVVIDGTGSAFAVWTQYDPDDVYLRHIGTSRYEAP